MYTCMRLHCIMYIIHNYRGLDFMLFTLGMLMHYSYNSCSLPGSVIVAWPKWLAFIEKYMYIIIPRVGKREREECLTPLYLPVTAFFLKYKVHLHMFSTTALRQLDTLFSSFLRTLDYTVQLYTVYFHWIKISPNPAALPLWNTSWNNYFQQCGKDFHRLHVIINMGQKFHEINHKHFTGMGAK